MSDAEPAFETARRLFFSGLAAYEAGRHAEAERDFLASLEAVPGRISTLMNLASARLKLRRPDAALTAIDAVLAASPDEFDALALRAITLARLDRREQALAAYDRALAVDAGVAELWSQRGSLLREMGRLAEAAKSFERAGALGGESRLNGYFLAAVRGDAPPPAPPAAYVEALFDDYASDFDAHL